ncbi:arabinose efflux permease family protein [Thermobacillus composti KWC4]|uniref:Arabinose efflux permease family protein n=1 Tax=Thermobacillus composti (strain DSM 18247 / JCM 13945 / KWC4) TaxID=717605 RepID=L0EBF0_THECK|nr:MFS transporter [Thermobacillus composti]AGA57593.1 arabinose efflux permease family protein [Thermobacillus composti KWC4]
MEKARPGWLTAGGGGAAAERNRQFLSGNRSDSRGRSGAGTGGGARKWAGYTALASVPLVMVLGNSMIVPILPDLERQLNITGIQSSLVITLFSLATGLFIPIAGYLSDRFTRKAVILPSLAVFGAAGLLAGYAVIWKNYPLLIAARALQGIGAAGTAPIAMALIGDMYRDGAESEALGLIEASNGTGKVLSPILGTLFALIAWQAPFFAFPAFCALSLAAMAFMIREPGSGDRPRLAHYARQIIGVFRAQGSWLIPAFLAGATGLFNLFGVLFFLSDVLEKPPYAITGVAKGGVLAIPLFGLVATSYATGRWIKNNGRLMRTLMNTGLALQAAAFAAAVWLNGNMPLLIALLTLSSVGTGMLLPCLNTMITGAVDRSLRGMITSLYSSLRFLGVAFGPPAFGWLAGISRGVLFGAVTGLAAVALALVFFLVKPPKRAGDAG